MSGEPESTWGSSLKWYSRASHVGDGERNLSARFDGALCFRERALRVEVGVIDAGCLVDDHLPPPSSDTQCPPSVAAGSRSKMRGGSTSRAMPLQSSGSTVMNRLPSLSCDASGSTDRRPAARYGGHRLLWPRLRRVNDLRAASEHEAERHREPRDRRQFGRTFAPNRPFGRKLAVAGGGRGGHLFQTPFGHSVFDAVGELRARPGTGGLAAGLPDLG